MNQPMIERLEGSFESIAHRGPELVDRFYANLFARHPAVRAMFPPDMAGQKKKLLASLALVVKNLRTPETLMEPLRDMGARHVEYGTQPEHYPVVRDTLVDRHVADGGQRVERSTNAGLEERSRHGVGRHARGPSRVRSQRAGVEIAARAAPLGQAAWDRIRLRRRAGGPPVGFAPVSEGAS